MRRDSNPDTHPDGCRCAACTAYCPTPEEILARCAEIQARWNKATEVSRRAVRPRGWTPLNCEVQLKSRRPSDGE